MNILKDFTSQTSRKIDRSRLYVGKIKTAQILNKYEKSSIITLDEVKEISNSNIINLKTSNDIIKYFKKTYNIDVLKIPKNVDLDGLKVILSGVDDSIKDFKVDPNAIKSITYISNLGVYGEMSSNGKMKIGKKAMGSYGTGVHETVHALDFYESQSLQKSYSNNIIDKARKEIKIRKNSRKEIKYKTEIASSFWNDDYEVLAYSIEKEYKTDKSLNELSKEIYIKFMEDRK